MRMRLIAKFSAILALLELLGQGNAMALGLGQISVHSRLGERLRAEVELVEGDSGERISADCFRLSTSPDPYSTIPVLQRAHISLVRQSGKRRLLISSEQPVNDPLLQISLRAGCNAEVVRDYMLIIDPVDTNSNQAARREAAVRPARDLRQDTADSPSMQKLTRRSPDSPPEALAADRPRPERRRTPARKSQSATAQMSDQLRISASATGEENRLEGLTLRLATELSDGAPYGATENQRALLRLEYRVLTAMRAQADEQLSLAEQVRTLESAFSELRSAAEKLVPPAAQSQAPASPTTIPMARNDPAQRTSPRSDAQSLTAMDRWIGSAGVGALLAIVGLLVWIFRRQAQRAAPPAPGLETSAKAATAELSLPNAPETRSTAEGDLNLAPPAQHLRENDGTSAESQPSAPLRRGVAPAPEPVPAAPGQPPHETAVLAEQSGFNPVIELADIMLAFGRIKGATETLLDYIEANPEEALQPWIKLLDIYRLNGMRQEYESLAQRLRQHFNVAPANWETSAELPPRPDENGDEGALPFAALLPRLPSIGQIVHVRDEIARTWGSRESLVYIDKLLRDNRQGERQGFALSTVNELLFLLAILEKRFNPS